MWPSGAAGAVDAFAPEGFFLPLLAILNLESTMMKHALFVRLEAKPGKEKELAQFLPAVA